MKEGMFSVVCGCIGLALVMQGGGCSCVESIHSSVWRENLFGFYIAHLGFMWYLFYALFGVIRCCPKIRFSPITTILTVSLLGSLVFGTSAAMGIAYAIKLDCPFCKAAWTLNVLISFDLALEIAKAPVTNKFLFGEECVV